MSLSIPRNSGRLVTAGHSPLPVLHAIEGDRRATVAAYVEFARRNSDRGVALPHFDPSTPLASRHIGSWNPGAWTFYDYYVLPDVRSSTGWSLVQSVNAGADTRYSQLAEVEPLPTL
jgi:hypothetical protein